jgi:hypothetical protein
VTTLYTIDCSGAVEATPTNAPPLEGGMAIAPRGFGRVGGDLVATDEGSGQIFALDPNGKAHLIATPSLPTGGDIGVESVGFVPPRAENAYIADRATAANPHPGTGAILRVGMRALRHRGVRTSDLLAVTEGGALTVRVRCFKTCKTRLVADGPAVAHVEGHVAFF